MTSMGFREKKLKAGTTLNGANKKQKDQGARKL